MKPVLLKTVYLIAALILLLTGCSQKDSTVGSDLVGGLTDPEEIIVDPSASAFYQTQATTGASPYLFIGFVQDYETRTLLMFSPGGVLPDSYAVDSAYIKLFVDSVFTDDPIQVEVIPVNEEQEWAEIGVTWDSLDSLNLGDPITSFEITAETDSVAIPLPQPFDPVADSVFADSLIRAWDAAGSGEKTLFYNHGLLLKAETTTDQMVRFASAENETVERRPTLEMIVTAYDTTDTTGSFPMEDTLSLYAGGDAFIVTDYVGITDSTRLYLGNSLAHRSFLYFDLEGLLPTYGVGIQRAEVTLHADTSHPANIGKIDGSFHLRMEDTTWISNPEEAPIAFGDVPVLSVYDEETATLTMKLTDFVYDWVEDPSSNHGFVIKSYNEYLDLSRTVFYGIDAPDSLKPKMKILYLIGGP
jgi:hypothetical protein